MRVNMALTVSNDFYDPSTQAAHLRLPPGFSDLNIESLMIKIGQLTLANIDFA
jgi:hypothetical protein